MISKKQFIADVLYEATVLRNEMTDTEKSRLNFDTLSPEYLDKCIYGQATGHCGTRRAKKLMDKACVRVSKCIKGSLALRKRKFSDIRHMINGKNEGQGWRNNGCNVKDYSMANGSRNWTYLSMIETYILLESSNNKGLIQYIKGEIDTVKL